MPSLRATAADRHPGAGRAVHRHQQRRASTARAWRPPPPPTTARCWPRPRPSASSSTWRATTSGARCAPSCPTPRSKPSRPTTQSRMFYRVSAQDGEMVSGFAELPLLARQASRLGRPTRRWSTSTTPTSATSRCAWRCCCSRWPARSGRGMAVVQVAETLELRETLARKLLVDTLWRQLVLMARDRRRHGARGAARHPAGARARRGDRRRAPPTISRPSRRPMRRANCAR